MRHESRRLPDWPTRLDRYVCAMRDVPFAWGVNDCVSFAAGAVEAMTGVRPALPTWSDARDAMRELEERGGIAAATDDVLQRAPSTRFARRGDIVSVDNGDRQWLAVCIGGMWCAPGKAGLEFGPMNAARAAWMVG